ncbi:kelch domain-containing protein 1-like [Gadus chalcogrammus]|uniref:kelch domain-containing protein 1-like n=1 Tax=Gadus chalcogrammus TaxID=1042646 RepID=UPI0024C2DB9D|nr:kelch domain-containing protein 1-like [Gadus chalcogrammus]
MTERHRSELVAQERSGHTAVVEDNLLYVWGGYVTIADDEVFLPNFEIWIYDMDRGLWEMSSMRGDVPPAMSGTCGCSLNGHLYIFGGCDSNGQTNEIYSVNLLDGKYTWKKISKASGAPPSPRDKLSCWVFGGRITFFGGYGHKLRNDINRSNFILDEASWVDDVYWGWNNEVHVFDPNHASWTEPQTNGRPPAPRAAHASATLGSKGYVCGGRVMETRTNDVHCLDLETWTWAEIVSPLSAVPVGRSWHSLTAVADSSLFLFGGLSVDCKPMSDGWLLNVETKKWQEISHPYENKPRLWHTASAGKDSDVIVFGGSCDYILLVDTGHCNDALVFQTEPYPLFRSCVDYIAKNVSICKMLGDQIPLLPSKLQHIVHRRMSYYRPPKNRTLLE